MDGCDNPNDRSTLVEKKPYVNGPERIGVFALRSPERPNPIAVSNVNIAYWDEEAGTIGLYYIDAFSGSISSRTYQVSTELSILSHRNGAATGQSPMRRAAILIGLRSSIFKER